MKKTLSVIAAILVMGVVSTASAAHTAKDFSHYHYMKKALTVHLMKQSELAPGTTHKDYVNYYKLKAKLSHKH